MPQSTLSKWLRGGEMSFSSARLLAGHTGLSLDELAVVVPWPQPAPQSSPEALADTEPPAPEPEAPEAAGAAQ